MASEIAVSFLSKLAEKTNGYALRENDKATLESLKNNVPFLCAKAADVDDAIKKAEISGTKKRKREVQEWLQQVQATEREFQTISNKLEMEGFVRQFFHGGEAAKLNTRVRELMEQTKIFGEVVPDDYNVKGEKFLTKEMVGKEFDENFKKIWNFLVRERVSSIGIYGMGGAGKTTLAKHTYNRLLKRGREHVVWVTVSQECSIRILQDKLAKELSLDLIEECEERRATTLRRALSEKKIGVLVLDDVWNEIDLMKLGDPLSVCRCRLLITSRSEAVCRQLNCKDLIKVNKLVKCEAWKLFRETLGQATNITSEIQSIAESMVDECNGLPLGIISIARSMRGESSISVWSDALEKLREQDLQEDVYKVLKQSFDWMAQSDGKGDGYSESQLCFLFCSLFPDDFVLEREQLVRSLYLEGFLGKRKSRKAMFTQGHAIVDKLVNACLLERDMTIYINGVKMNNLMRNMATKITKGVYFHYSLPGIPIEEEKTKDIQRMYLSSDVRSLIMPLDFPKLLTLLLDVPFLEFIPDSFFFQMRSLCILDLSYSCGRVIKELPDSLSSMLNLKALVLEGCRDIHYVPYLGKLKKLRELDLAFTQIGELPGGVEELTNLRFLSLYNSCWEFEKFPEHLLSKFPYLQCLLLPMHIEAPVDEIIKKLEHLEEFRGRVKDASAFNLLISGWENFYYEIIVGSDVDNEDYEHLGYNQLSFTECDLKDGVVLAKSIQYLCLEDCKGLSKCLLESLPLLNPNSIKKLDIYRCDEIECLERVYRGGKISFTSTLACPAFPPPTLSSFSSLISLNIYACGTMKKLGLEASNLINLAQLWICSCEMIEEIFETSTEEDIGGETSLVMVSLPKLKRLSLDCLPRLRSICNATLACSSIEVISLEGCQALKKLALVSGELPNCDSPPPKLRYIYIKDDEKEWWEKLELGHTTHHSLLQPFIEYRSY